MIRRPCFFPCLMSLVLLCFWGGVGPASALEVEMPTCEMIQNEIGKGFSLPKGIFNLVGANQSQEDALYESTMKTIIRDAIKECDHEPEDVIFGAYRGEVPIEIIFTAAQEAGVKQKKVERIIKGLGANPEEIEKRKPKNGLSSPPISILRGRKAPIGSGLND